MHGHICLANRISTAVVKDWFVKITGWFLLQSGIHSNTLTANAIFFWFLLHVFKIVTNEFFNWIYLFFLFFINWFSLLLNCFQKFILIWLFLHKIVWKLLKFILYKSHLGMRSYLKWKKLLSIHVFNWDCW